MALRKTSGSRENRLAWRCAGSQCSRESKCVVMGSRTCRWSWPGYPCLSRRHCEFSEALHSFLAVEQDWIASSQVRDDGTNADTIDLEPALPALEALQVLETLALVAGAAKIKLLDVLVVAQFVRAAVEHHLALFHDVAMARHRQRGAGVLFDQQDGDAEVAVDF